MNKLELTKQISELLNVTHTESIRHLEALQKVMTLELEREGSIMLQGFGVFTPWKQTERLGRNPRSGVPCMIEKRVSVKFKPGKKLLEVLNEKECCRKTMPQNPRLSRENLKLVK